jgi:hypothetical protein
MRLAGDRKAGRDHPRVLAVAVIELSDSYGTQNQPYARRR